jgi:hypothetical protein
MTVEKVDNGRKIKWFVFDSKHRTIAGFTTKRVAIQAMKEYEKRGLDD